MVGPELPRVIGERVSAIRRQVLSKFAALILREARADAYVLQHTRIVEEPEQQRSDGHTLASLMPSKTRNDAVAVALVLDLEHHALV